MTFIKEIFLKLTEYTIPYGSEKYLEPILKEFNLKKDAIGNYYISIGKSDTLFTTHLDTYSKKFEKVNHVIEGNIIKTDGKTILGGDNKLGCSILLYMIKNNIPGNYYFFLGEEPIISGGLWGSSNALRVDGHKFKKFKRAIAFDRKQTGSVVIRQMARFCCSLEFANAICEKFGENGLPYKPDSRAYYTDTATFMDTIPECTNISAGGWNEHYTNEYVDILYTEQVAEAAIKIDWESLPVNRQIKEYKVVNKKENRKIPKKLLDAIMDMLDKYDQMHTNKLEFHTGNTNELEFNQWFEDTNIRLKFDDKGLFLKIDKEDWKKIPSLRELDLVLSEYLGVYLDEAQNGIELTNTDIIIDGEAFKYDEYIKLFNSINTETTSYKTKRGGAQYEDITGLTLYKSQFLQYLYSLFK